MSLTLIDNPDAQICEWSSVNTIAKADPHYVFIAL